MQVIFEKCISVQDQASCILQMSKRTQHELSKFGVAEQGEPVQDGTCSKIGLLVLHNSVSAAAQDALPSETRREAEPHQYAFPGRAWERGPNQIICCASRQGTESGGISL